MKVSIPDDVYAKYEAAAAAAKIPPDQLIGRQLARFGDTPVTRRMVVLGPEQLEALEGVLRGGQIRTPEDLLKRVKAFGEITIGGIHLDFSPAQLAEIGHRAEKQGKSPKVIVEEIVRQMESNFFWEPVVTR